MYESRKGENAFAEALSKVEGVSDIKRYSLINNYGWTFTKRGFRFDVRFIANCYGVYVGVYELFACGRDYAMEFNGKTSSADLSEILETIKAI